VYSKQLPRKQSEPVPSPIVLQEQSISGDGNPGTDFQVYV
jgi:hypothetical protein